VAIDANGNIAAATSTGGLTGKLSGRIGDSPIVGIGTYASELAGFSATGEGEVIMKAVLSHDIIKRMEYLKQDIQTAAQEACDEMTRKFDGDGGVIGIDRGGNIAVALSSDQMSWAYQKGDKVFYGINPGDNFSEDA
jgi:beta-aspartyl-peptidase (threonine type)